MYSKANVVPTYIFLIPGRFHLIGKTGRIEKSVESHNGATLVGRWSHDGAGILTGKLHT